MRKQLVIGTAILALLITNVVSYAQTINTTEKDRLLSEIKKKLSDTSTNQSLFDTRKRTLTEGEVFYRKLKNLLSPTDMSPVDLETADTLFERAKPKIGKLQTEFKPTLNQGKETRSILVSVDSLKKLVDSLSALQERNDHKTGIRIVFGNYDHRANATDEKMSGRLTVFFIGTMDSEPTNTRHSLFTWRTQKDLTLFSNPQLVGYILPRNHGDLCPNSCTPDNTRYKD